MKKIFFILAVLTLLSLTSVAVQEARFLRFPDIHGNTIVFTYENDLWLIEAGGGPARRITSFPGAEYAAKFSPDGRWIAFTGTYDGPTQVYLIPAEGGEPKRLTYHPGDAQTLAWTPDGEKIVFRSFFENFIQRDPNLYFVSRSGGVPERLPLDRGVLCSFSADGKKMLYCRKGREEYQWKRYQGGQYQDIWLYDFASGRFTPVSDYVGKNSYPMWIGGQMAFVCDRDNGIANLYLEDLDTKKMEPLTRFNDFDVMMPRLGRQIHRLHAGRLPAPAGRGQPPGKSSASSCSPTAGSCGRG